MKAINTGSLSGFPELLPEEQLVFDRYFRIIRNVYEQYGFSPLETPAVERKEVLVSKGAEDKEIYALSRLTDDDSGSSQTDLALRFDLTVPLARYVAAREKDITFPFRRYQMQPVWRGERAQKGRYRQFYQCDIDVIGKESLDVMYDAEMPSIIVSIFEQFHLGDFVVRINNRRILSGYFEHMGVSDQDVPGVLRCVDKLEKVGIEKVAEEVGKVVSISREAISSMLDFLGKKRSIDEMLGFLEVCQFGETFRRGVAELRTVVSGMRSLGVEDKRFEIDLSIARGLGYYTGTVYETRLLTHPELGSVCSGGRYDDLAGYFTDKAFPGVGISIGLTRLIVPLIQSGEISTGPSTPARVLVTVMDSQLLSECLLVGKELRQAGICTEIFLEKKSLKVQMRYANRKGFRFVVVLGESECESETVSLKDMTSGESFIVGRSQLVNRLLASE